MNIIFALVSPSRKESPIRVIITHKGKVFRKSIGLSCPAIAWSRVKHKSNRPAINERLKEIRDGLESVLDADSTFDDVEFALSRVEGGHWNDTLPMLDRPTFWQHFHEWSERPCTSQRQHRLTYNTVLRLMGGVWTWENMDARFYQSLIKKMQENGYSPNYQGNIVQRVKTVMSEGRKMGYHSNMSYLKWKRPSEESFSIALTESEMMLLWEGELTPGERRVADLAWLGYLTASRFSDYSRLTSDNIYQDCIRFFQKKTDGEVMIPCSPKIRTIFERNGGHAPRISAQVFNREIKEVCRKVGIDSIIQVPKSTRLKKGWPDDKQIRKWELVSSHSFRRSGASALYRSGVPARVVRYLTGHTTDKQLFKYIKIDKEEGLEMLSQSAFFK